MKHTNRMFAFLLGMLLCAMPLAATAETEVTRDAVAPQEPELLIDDIEAELPGELELAPLELLELELTETELSFGNDDAAEPAQESIRANSDADDFEIEDGVLRAYHGKGGEVVIPKGVTIIGAYVFAGSAVTKVTIPDSVKSVQEGAFSGCTALKDVRFGKGVTEIGSSAFEEAGLTKVTIPGGVKTIDGKKYWSAWSTAKKVKVK